MKRLLGMTQSAFDPASRFRFKLFIPHYQAAGWEVVHRPNVPDRQWSSSLPTRVLRAVHHRIGKARQKWNRWRDVQSAKQFDAVFVNRDLCYRGIFFESCLLRNNPSVVFDFDDAIFLGKNEPANRWMCTHAAHVTPGNEYLAQYARQFSKNVTVIPTVIDTEDYQPRAYNGAQEKRPVRIGWSGSDQSIGYALFPYLEILARLQQETDFELVVITNTKPTLPVPNIRWSFWPWSSDTEIDQLQKLDVGIMPLTDDKFSRGKCGLKLLQYMAVGVPTVASPVGVNAEITDHGITGFSASTEDEWRESLQTLLGSYKLRASCGEAGRLRCEQHYSIKRWLPVLLDIFEEASKQKQA